jgi:hypothetical protein
MNSAARSTTKLKMDAMEREGVSSPRRWSRVSEPDVAGYRGISDSSWGVALLFIVDVLDVWRLFQRCCLLARGKDSRYYGRQSGLTMIARTSISVVVVLFV